MNSTSSTVVASSSIGIVSVPCNATYGLTVPFSVIHMGVLLQKILSLYRLVTGWAVRGSSPGGGEIFRTCPDGPWGPPNLLYNWYRVFPRGKERPGRDADPSPPSSAVGHERVELYLYSSYGPNGLYRASVPVQGCTLPLPLPLPISNKHQ